MTIDDVENKIYIEQVIKRLTPALRVMFTQKHVNIFLDKCSGMSYFDISKKYSVPIWRVENMDKHVLQFVCKYANAPGIVIDAIVRGGL